MCWNQFLSSNCVFLLEFISFTSCCTSVNCCPVKVQLCGAFLTWSVPIRCITFQTDDKRESLGIKVILFQSTNLNEISFAFSYSMLTCVIPFRSTLSSFCITIRIKSKITDFPEILNIKSYTFVFAAVLRDFWINCWQYGQRDS